MADQQRIHPVPDQADLEAQRTPTPTVPLVPRGAAKSDDAEPRRQYPPYQQKPPKKRTSCCCKCFCWTISLILILIVSIAIAAGILYLVFQPKLPKYSVDRMRITRFNLTADSSLASTFDVTITATNPNKKIGIYYEGGSLINVWYTDTKLCEGSLPRFYQGHQNTTVLSLPLTGQIQNADTLYTSLQQQQQQTGNIPLNLHVDQHVRVKLGLLKLMKVKFLVRCRLLVDSLSSNNALRIQSSTCNFSLRL